jgi:hypothetical protein
MEEKKDCKTPIISKETLMPLSLILVILGGVWFMSALNSDVQNSKSRMDKMEDTIAEVARVQNQITELTVKINNIEKVLTEMK